MSHQDDIVGNKSREFGIRFMTDEMLEAREYYKKTKNKPITFGQSYRIYFPAHSDMNCWCNQCTTYRLSKGEQPVFTIKIPSIYKEND